MLLVLTEKPSAARNFARALGGMHGTFGGEDYSIFALRGHVLELDKDFANQVQPGLVERYESWKIENLPWDPNDLSFTKVVKQDCGAILDGLTSAIKSADEVIIATDNDPSGEGELLAWEALDFVGWPGKTTRAFFADEAPASIRKAIEARTPIVSMDKDGDYLKALARERFDFCSMQYVRAATDIARSRGCKLLVREGRLKSVMVKLVGDQQKAHDDYVKKPYFEVRFSDENGNVFKREGEDLSSWRFASKDEVNLSGFASSRIAIDSTTPKTRAPGKLLDLAALSAICAKAGFKPKDVLSTYQKMYEDQVVSYPRTEDKFITPEQFAELLPLAPQIARVVGVSVSLLAHKEPRKSHVKEGCAHGANRPGTNVPASLDELAKYGAEAPLIYETLAKNYLAMLADDYEYNLIKAHLSDYPEFVSSSQVPTKLGFRSIFDSEAQSDDDASDDLGNSFGKVAEPFVFEGANKRPAKPSMKWLNKQLEKHNVGTGATRTSTLADVTQGGDKALLDENRGILALTECGKVSWVLIDRTNIASVEVTERLFEQMEAVGRFEASIDEVVNFITPLLVSDIEVMKANATKLESLPGTENLEVACPVCGEPLIERGKIITCTSNKNKQLDDGSWQQIAGCGFKIMAKPYFFGKQLSRAQCLSLLSGKRVLVKGLKSKAGKPYDAYARLSKNANPEGFHSIDHDGFPERKSKNKRFRK